MGDNDFYIVYLIARLQLENLKHSSSGEDSTKEYVMCQLVYGLLNARATEREMAWFAHTE